MKKLKVLSVVTSVFMMAAMLTACGSSSQTTGASGTDSSGESTASDSIKVTVLGEFDPQILGQQIIAMEKGFFAEEGLEVDLQLLTDPSVSTTMVASGEAQFYSISNYQAINLVDKGSEVCLLAPVVNAGNTQVIVGAPGLEITTAKDLEGKKMGYTDGAGVIVAVKNMCDDLGVDFDSFELVNLQAADMLAALEAGSIDFFAAWEPWGIKAEEFGGQVLFTGTKSYLPDNTGDVNYLDFIVCIDASADFAEENPEACKAYLRAMIKATDYINANPDECAEIIAAQINLDTETCKAIMEKNVYSVGFDQTFKDSCDTLSEYMLSSGLNTSLVEFDSFTNTELLAEVDSSLVSYE
ncbi:MAG: ABC transporter substrate-binding protein [Oscillospiraceae bacterium]|nr:ABC transporter substrate-binding protein [Oscillospiraceae bacterium]